MYPDTLKYVQIFSGDRSSNLYRQTPFLYLETNTPGTLSRLPGPYWVILHMIYTPIMRNPLVDFVTYRGVTNVLDL